MEHDSGSSQTQNCVSCPFLVLWSGWGSCLQHLLQRQRTVVLSARRIGCSTGDGDEVYGKYSETMGVMSWAGDREGDSVGTATLTSNRAVSQAGDICLRIWKSLE